MSDLGPHGLDFARGFEALTGHAPFPWQARLFDDFLSQGRVPPSCGIPTGLGKTAVLAVWLIALARGAWVPRRLVYVVNRRTVVDQTTREAERLKANAHKVGINDLAISTLRGQYADNREWSADPSRPAIICGTVDMIGSRLLFAGYGVGFRARPLHAGFLGQDALLVHDEAHLEPAFQRLIEAIDAEQKRCNDKDLFPLRVMQLTATTRSGNASESGEALGLTEEEANPPSVLPDPPTKPIHHVWHRLKATKKLVLHDVADDKAVADSIAKLALEHKDGDAAVLVFVRRLEDVETVCSKLEKAGVGHGHVERLTGTMRGLERDRMADPRRPGASPVFARFLRSPGPNASAVERWAVEPMPGTVYLVCTSAGEVGVDLSADHLVCDLSTLDSMAQRLGRVNRYGERADTRVDVVYPTELDEKDKLTPARRATLDLLNRLGGDASPRSLNRLMSGLPEEQREAAFSPKPTILPATDILFDAWALTSIREKMPGRPHVEPYLHGIEDWQPPETHVAWREEVAEIAGDLLARHPPQNLLDDYPLKPHELLRDRTDRVYTAFEALIAVRLEADERRRRIERARENSGAKIWLIDDGGSVTVTTLGDLMGGDKKQVLARLAHRTVLLSPLIGGLSAGMLDGASEQADDVAHHWLDDDDQPRRERRFSEERVPTDGPEHMALLRTIDTNPDAEELEPPEEEIVLDIEEAEPDTEAKATRRPGRFWHWYARPRDTEDATRASATPITWDDHTRDVVQRTTEIVTALSLPDDLRQAVILAAELHDLGKKREMWQRSIGNPRPTAWHAKPGKPDGRPRWQPRFISPYRHEFGSLLDALDADQAHRAQLDAMTDEMRDVVLHLIAAHHGYARPHFLSEATVDPNHPQSASDDAAIAAMRRYAWLQRCFGRWGLAYLESLLRAADWAASAEPSAFAEERGRQKMTAEAAP